VFRWLSKNPGWLMILDNADTREAAAEVEKTLPQLQNGEVIITAARQWLEKERPSLVAARDQAIVELRREKLQKETAEKPHRVARVRR
jgi:hypothetical protein